MTDATPSPAKPAPVKAERRMFLRGAAVAAAAVPLSASAERLVQPTEHQVGARYQETAHVKRFYELNRR